MYHRIHLSNIPDYIGGTLTSFKYALPLIWPCKESYITAVCLLNPPKWQSVAHFKNEYVGLSAPSDLEKTFHVRMSPMEDGAGDFLPMADYLRWHHNHKSKTLPDLMPRHALETWLYRLFLKLAIPKERPMRDIVRIYSPLNLSAFVWLYGHLFEIDYPAHWLSGVLTSILSGKIKTRARPPRSDPLKIREVKVDMPALDQSTAPFVMETRTLLSICQSILPFRIIATDLPITETIRKYSFQLEEVPDDPVAESPSFVLVFFDTSMLYVCKFLYPLPSLRTFLNRMRYLL